MLDLKGLSQEFDAKLSVIKSYDIKHHEAIHEYRHELERLKDININMNQRLNRYSGAKLLEVGKLIRSFPFKWNSRHEAITWVDSVLSGICVGAVDGSQIYSNNEIPVAVIQTSGVFNRHTKDSDYKQHTKVRILTPDEFEKESVYSFGKEYVDARRFSMECEHAMQLMREHENIYTFLDGGLLLSHINVLNKNIRDIYIKAITRLLETSENLRNPVIGFMDATMPRDITLMMHLLFGLKKSKLSDTYLFSNLSWGERTASFLCDRDDRRSKHSASVLDNYGRFRDRIAFFYIKISKALPARVEFPVWVYEEGMVDNIADIVRAECIIRGGYPDILMRAHETALIRMSEHSLFYGMLENFCKTHGIELHKSAKFIHKMMNW